MSPRQHKRAPRMNRDLVRGAKEEREKARYERVERLMAAALKTTMEAINPAELFNTTQALIQLEEARMLAMALEMPGDAVKAVLAKGKFMGLLIDRKQDVPPGQSPMAAMREQEAVIMEQLAERIGSAGAEQFRMAVQIMREAYEGDNDVIEGEAEEGPEQ